jgi:hypothetical protein
MVTVQEKELMRDVMTSPGWEVIMRIAKKEYADSLMEAMVSTYNTGPKEELFDPTPEQMGQMAAKLRYGVLALHWLALQADNFKKPLDKESKL